MMPIIGRFHTSSFAMAHAATPASLGVAIFARVRLRRRRRARPLVAGGAKPPWEIDAPGLD
jgi:hypothetical protein